MIVENHTPLSRMLYYVLSFHIGAIFRRMKDVIT